MKHNSGFLKIVEECKKQIKECSVEQVVDWQKKGDAFVLVDCREESEWANGRIPGAIHIGKGVIERDIETKVPDHAAKIVIYCGGGFRSALAAENLQRMGYQDVISMDGGIRVWREQNLPEVKE